MTAYDASKWGLRGLTKGAALEFAPYGIRINSLHPGAIDTPMLNPEGKDTGHACVSRTNEPECPWGDRLKSGATPATRRIKCRRSYSYSGTLSV
jgi:NAD(P)-dependent dehydrogenase (short-subunit alcohol dehydrogenase family)